MTDLIEILDGMASQPKDQQFGIRLSQADKAALAKLAQAYHRPMGQVVIDLIRQGIIDYLQEGECFALSKY